MAKIVCTGCGFRNPPHHCCCSKCGTVFPETLLQPGTSEGETFDSQDGGARFAFPTLPGIINLRLSLSPVQLSFCGDRIVNTVRGASTDHQYQGVKKCSRRVRMATRSGAGMCRGPAGAPMYQTP
ncbi:MAG: hypothetical protein M1162_04795 [Candidatus Thermoplasmatota archaeon]|nr:hypothetical protein [Candidatus Thermoplasmatota archaeon]